MEVHNIVEDVVMATVQEAFAEESRKPANGYCTCPQCMLDVACYALNRMKAEYVVSGRGLAHSSKDYQATLQRQADASSLVAEGWKRINQTRRPAFDHAGSKKARDWPHPPVFNFPTIIGRVFEGMTFSPMDGVQVSLLRDGQPVRMMDANWQNPCSLRAATGGTYIFWPYPEKADALGETALIELTLRAEADGFEPLEHHFNVRVHAEDAIQDSFSMQRSRAIPDLLMFKPGDSPEVGEDPA